MLNIFLIVVLVILIIILLLCFCKKNKNDNFKLPKCFTTNHQEEGERRVAHEFTKPDACVLEIGGGAGSVSTIIQKKLINKHNHVVIQPAEHGMYGGLDNLQKNKTSCKNKYHIIGHILKKDEGYDLLKLVTKPFDTLIVDCENCLVGEYEKNPMLFHTIKQIQVERDDFDGSYDKLFKKLKFEKIYTGSGCDGKCATEVWER